MSALYGMGPKYSNPSTGITIAAITITAVLNCRFSLRLLPLLRSSTKGGACTGLTAIYPLQIGQDMHTAHQATQYHVNIRMVRRGCDSSSNCNGRLPFWLQEKRCQRMPPSTYGSVRSFSCPAGEIETRTTYIARLRHPKTTLSNAIMNSIGNGALGPSYSFALAPRRSTMGYRVMLSPDCHIPHKPVPASS